MEENKEEKPKFDEKSLFLEKTEELVKRNETAVEEMKKLVERNEEMAAKSLLGGKSNAGEQEEQPKEETPQDYTKKVMSGEVKFK